MSVSTTPISESTVFARSSLQDATNILLLKYRVKGYSLVSNGSLHRRASHTGQCPCSNAAWRGCMREIFHFAVGCMMHSVMWELRLTNSPHLTLGLFVNLGACVKQTSSPDASGNFLTSNIAVIHVAAAQVLASAKPVLGHALWICQQRRLSGADTNDKPRQRSRPKHCHQRHRVSSFLWLPRRKCPLLIHIHETDCRCSCFLPRYNMHKLRQTDSLVGHGLVEHDMMCK